MESDGLRNLLWVMGTSKPLKKDLVSAETHYTHVARNMS